MIRLALSSITATRRRGSQARPRRFPTRRPRFLRSPRSTSSLRFLESPPADTPPRAAVLLHDARPRPAHRAKGFESSIGAAIGVHHQDHAPGSMQPYRLANLFQHKRAFALALRRGQALGAARDLDWIGIHHADAFEKLAKPQLSGYRSTTKCKRRSDTSAAALRSRKPFFMICLSRLVGRHSRQ